MTTIVRRKRAEPERPNVALDKVVIGIDQSYSSFGIVALQPNGEFVKAQRGFDPKHSSGISRLNDIAEWLRKFIYDTPQEIVHICMEGYAPGAKFGREIAGELGATVKMTLLVHPRLYRPAKFPTIVAPTQVKQYAASNSSAKKEDMKLQVYKRWGVEFKTNDEADAYVIARIAAGIAFPDEEMTEYQRALIKRLTPHTELAAMEAKASA